MKAHPCHITNSRQHHRRRY